MNPALPGAVVAVTGGARGIGRATAEAFRAGGARVAIGDIDAELADKAVAEMASTPGPAVVGLPLDVTDRSSFVTFLDTAEHELGPLDVLVNNAGIMPTGGFLDETDSTTGQMLDINLRGVLDGTRLAASRFVSRGGGMVINIASLAGVAGIPGLVTYCASKHAVVGLSEAAYRELRNTGVHVAAVLPGVVRTELSAGAELPPWLEGFTTVDPTDVAEAVVHAATTRKPKLTVPTRLGALLAVASLLPPGAQQLLERFTRLDTAFLHADPQARATYHNRLPGVR
ncbi:SDR family oxidoreductase [Haloechinothrix sp. LS1_15]|nr:SDR family oxidoreductase [Haloechinothrix sp. LS1_15]